MDVRITASQVAAELRKLADALDKEPDAKIVQAWITFSNRDDKESFLNLARLMPRPLKKEYGKNYIDLIHGDFHGPLYLKVEAYRSTVCRMVQPAQEAVYDCEPLLSLEEEASLAGGAQ